MRMHIIILEDQATQMHEKHIYNITATSFTITTTHTNLLLNSTLEQNLPRPETKCLDRDYPGTALDRDHSSLGHHLPRNIYHKRHRLF